MGKTGLGPPSLAWAHSPWRRVLGPHLGGPPQCPLQSSTIISYTKVYSVLHFLTLAIFSALPAFSISGHHLRSCRGFSSFCIIISCIPALAVFLAPSDFSTSLLHIWSSALVLSWVLFILLHYLLGGWDPFRILRLKGKPYLICTANLLWRLSLSTGISTTCNPQHCHIVIH